SLSFCFFFVSCSAPPLALHSFPTRRSSDLFAGEVEHRVDEEAPGPGLEAGDVLQPVQLLCGDELHEGALDRVLEVVAQVGIALTGEGEPLPAERLEHLPEQRVWRRGPRRAQDG